MKNKIIFTLLIILSCEAIASSWNSVNGCYFIDNDGTKFNFYCSNAEKWFNETCAKSMLSKAMQKLNSSAVTELKMCSCAIDTLVNTMDKLENVRVLDISHSNYGSDRLFNQSIVDVLSNRKLVKLNAAHNNLTEIPDELFNKIPNLTAIDLSNNQLTTIKSTTFQGASELVEIHLQQNRLRNLEEGAFTDIAKMNYMDLRDNYISIHEFEYYPHLGVIDCGILSLLNNNHPIVIYISWQLIGTFDTRCIENEFKVSFNEHESIRFRNGIVELHCNQFSFRKLRRIWVKTNQMNFFYKMVSILGLTLESLEYLDVSDSDLMVFDFRILSKMKQLRDLHISKCNLKKVINPSVLQSINITLIDFTGNLIQNAHEIIEHLNPSIEILYLSGSFIGKLHSTAFTKMKNLRTLELDNTNLQMVDSHYPFDQLESLNHIDISSNNLNGTNFTISFPSALWLLNVSSCQIDNVLDVIQLQGTSVRTLDLSGNFVGKLNDTTFDQLKFMKNLYLKNTNLSFSNSNPFHKFDLESLDISNNNLKHVNFTVLSSTLENLYEFTAADCNIENVFDLIKLLRTDIEILDLSGNFVGRIDVSTFDKLTRLEELDLRNTSLTINDVSNPFEQLTLLYYLDISHNNLSNVNWTIWPSSLGRLRQFSVAECQIANAPDLIKLLGSFYIEHIDLSGNTVGMVNASTFARFEILIDLHLSNTGLVNFDFNILEHSKGLNLLDISHNRFTELNMSLRMDELETLDMCGCELIEIHNFDKFHLPNLKLLGISDNRLSCETLERLKKEWPRLEFIGNDQSQKHQPNCQKTIETTTNISTEELKPFTFKVNHILSMITSVIFFIAIVFLLFRYILCEKRCEKDTRNDDTELVVAPRGAAEVEVEHIYEEIVERIEPYDHLSFDPPPSSALQQHYENAPEPIDEPEVIYIANESIESREEIDD